jgi:hypothetical protein
MKRIPTFEIFITFLSYSLSAALFVNDHLFTNAKGWEAMGNVAEEWVFALIFFIAATVKVIGILFDIKPLRVVGLFLSFVIYLSVGVLMLISGSVFLPVMLGVTTFSCGMAAKTDVKYTKL